jgi:hypothetical protein
MTVESMPAYTGVGSVSAFVLEREPVVRFSAQESGLCRGHVGPKMIARCSCIKREVDARKFLVFR